MKRHHKHIKSAARFSWRALKFTGRKFWALPRWAKWLKVITLLILALIPYTLSYIDHQKQKRLLYDYYFPHYVAIYSRTMPANEAQYYADFYASYYADYFSSGDYEYALETSLPEATPETLSYPTSSPVASLTLDVSGIALIKQFEGIRTRPYLDVGGKLTIGYGHLVRSGQVVESITHSQADAMLMEDIRLAEAVVKRLVTVPLNQKQFTALVSLVFNIGPAQFEDSTLLVRLNERKYDVAADEFLRWNKVKKRTVLGLVRRRQKEREIFTG